MVQITFQEPVPPRRLQPKVPRDLETICLKCLEKEPARRYRGAAALADDLARFREGQPIQARLLSRTGQVLRWCWRKPWTAGLTAAVFLLVLTLGIGGPIVAYQQARLRRQAQEEKDRADKNFALAKQAVEATVSKLAQDERLGQEDFHPVRLELCQSLLPFYEEFVRQQEDDPKLQAERGVAFLWLAQVRREMGQLEQARMDFLQAQAIFVRLVAVFPASREYREQLAASHNKLGLLLTDLGRSSEAEGLHHQAMELHRQLAAEFPTAPECLQNLADSYHFLLRARREDRALLAEAETHQRAALALWQRRAVEFPAASFYRHGLASAAVNLAVLLNRAGQRAAAKENWLRSCELLEALAAESPRFAGYRVSLAINCCNLGWLMAVSAQPAEAEKYHRQALKLQEALVAEWPTVPQRRLELAASHTSLGVLLVNQGREAEAETHIRQALTIRRTLVAEFPTVALYSEELGDSLCDWGRLLCAKGQPEAALEWFVQSLATLNPVAAKDPGRGSGRNYLSATHAHRARALDQLGRHAEAGPDWEKAIALADDEEDRSEYQLSLAVSEARAGHYLQAVAAAEERARGIGLGGATWYRLARILALAAAGARDDSARERYAARAVALLQRAVEAGYFQQPKAAEEHRRDADFATLREREDYQRLLR